MSPFNKSLKLATYIPPPCCSPPVPKIISGNIPPFLSRITGEQYISALSGETAFEIKLPLEPLISIKCPGGLGSKGAALWSPPLVTRISFTLSPS